MQIRRLLKDYPDVQTWIYEFRSGTDSASAEGTERGFDPLAGTIGIIARSKNDCSDPNCHYKDWTPHRAGDLPPCARPQCPLKTAQTR